MTVKTSTPVTVVTVGPKVIAVAYARRYGKAADQTFTVPQAANAPWRKNYVDEADFFAAMADYAASESDRVADYCDILVSKAKGHKIVAIVSERAAAHSPADKIYSRIAAVEDLIAGLAIIADETITVP